MKILSLITSSSLCSICHFQREKMRLHSTYVKGFKKSAQRRDLAISNSLLASVTRAKRDGTFHLLRKPSPIMDKI